MCECYLIRCMREYYLIGCMCEYYLIRRFIGSIYFEDSFIT